MLKRGETYHRDIHTHNFISQNQTDKSMAKKRGEKTNSSTNTQHRKHETRRHEHSYSIREINVEQ